MRGRVRSLATRGNDGMTLLTGPVPLRRSGLNGQITSAISDDALFVYPWEHYSYWADRLHTPLPDAAFGENVTTMGLLESEVAVGDTFQWGPAVVQVSGPGPGTRTAGHAEPWRFPGFFLRVLTPGTVRADQELRLLDVDPVGISVADTARILALGPEAAGYSPERVLVARHLFPVDFVYRLEESAQPGDPELTAAG
jgi:MOSC domain